MFLNNFAPIVLFVYNRPEHTQRTLDSLKKNILAKDSDLFIYSDAAKNETVQNKVDEVRLIISKISGFKKVTIVKQEENKGLANSIIHGVTEIVDKYGRIIVLEDDLVTSPYFLTYMNSALDFNSDKKDVWHVSGWNYPIDTAGLSDVFFWRTMSCWGWATWSDRWKSFDKNIDQVIAEFCNDDIKLFNLDGCENFWGQVLANKEGKINTWAIFWYATIFKHNGLCLNPAQTFVNNIGLDGSGTHCDANESFHCNLSMNSDINYDVELSENQLALERIKLFYRLQKKSIVVRVINKISRLLVNKNWIQ